MKFLISFLVVLNIGPLWADGSTRSMIQIGNSGFGASGSYERFSPKADAEFDEFNITKGDLTLNYSYAFFSQFQLGLFYSNSHDQRRFKTANGSTGEIEFKSQHIGLQALWNFSENLQESWYLGALVSHMNLEDETSKTEPLNYLEDDRSAQSIDFILGKRFGLDQWGLKNISYSPSLSIFITNSQKDYEDDGIDKSYGFSLNLIKFDVLF